MISSIFKCAGQIIGEAVHQADVLIEDIKNIPEAIAAGYEEELFSKKVEEGTDDKTSKSDRT